MLPRLPALLLLLSTAALGQSTLSVRGTLTDPSGAVVPGATVELESAAGQPLAETRTDANGDFILLNVRPGDDTLVIPAATGFAPLSRPLHLVANVTGLKLTLAPSSVVEQIMVGAETGVSTDAAANQDTVAVTAADLRKLPIFDQDPIAALTAFLDASATGTGGVTLIVDGLEVKSLGVSASAIQEVRINNDPYSTEFNRPGRGRIEVITKPGSPDFHGEANFTFRDAIFNAKNHFASVRPPEARRIFEGHFTGPAGHGGRTTFIASGARHEQDTAVVVNAILPSGPLVANVLTPNRGSEAAFRVTHDFSASHRLAVAYTFEYNTRVNAGVGGLTLAEAGANTDSREDDLIFNDRILISPNLVNQLVFSFEKDEDVSRSVTSAQSIQVAGAFSRGGAQADSNRTENTLHLNEVVSWNHRRHYVRFGAQLPQVSRRAVDDRSNRLGTYQFASLAAYQSNTPYAFTAQQGPGRGLYWINEAGAFVQDQIKLTPRVQISVGLRYDWQTYVDDHNNFAPRFSIAYAPGKAKTVVRLGSGVFYDRTGGDFPTTFKLHNGIVLQSIQIQNPAYPIAPGTIFTAQPSSIVTQAPNLRSPYTIQSSLGVERQISKTLTVAATYRNAVQVKSFRSRDANAPILPPNPSLSATYARPNPNFARIQLIESGGRQLTNGLDLSLSSRGKWFAGQVQYTLARSYDNTGGINWFPQDQYHPNNEWGRSFADRLHTLNLLGTIHPEHWLSLGVALNLNSGTSYTEYTGTDYFHTGLGNARPAGIARHNLQAGGYANLNLLWEHEFLLTRATGDKAKVLTAGLGAFNVLNHTNYTGYIGQVTSPLFTRPTSSQPARQIQLSLGFRF